MSFCDPMDYIVHGILQAGILEWAAFPFSRGSSHPRDWTQEILVQSLDGEDPLKKGRSLHCRWILYQLSHKGRPRILEWVAYSCSRGSSQPRNGTGVSCIAGRFFTNWAIRVVLLWWVKIKTRPLHNHTCTLTETKALLKPQEWPNIFLSCLTRLTAPSLSITKL